MTSATRIAARYKSKKKIPGSDTVVYEYSERQVARRNNEKAGRLEKLRKQMSGLRSQVKKDLKSDDPDTALTALAVALIDHTYERVGNEGSAKGESTESGEKHYGVTTWQKSHISFGRGKATIKYVGKSGVKQTKDVTDKAIVSALKDAYEACGEDGLFCYDSGKVDAKKVNAYLKKFDITAKDLRGFHANSEMMTRLKKIRSGKLPEDKKEREKQLKEEFKQALEETAEAVGHEASTLRSQYLIPKLEETFLKDGTVLSKMKEASVIFRFMFESEVL